MAYRFNPPPNWPIDDPEWAPPPGWQPDPSWGPAPEGWSFWVDADNAATNTDATEQSADDDATHVVASQDRPLPADAPAEPVDDEATRVVPSQDRPLPANAPAQPVDDDATRVVTSQDREAASLEQAPLEPQDSAAQPTVDARGDQGVTHGAGPMDAADHGQPQTPPTDSHGALDSHADRSIEDHTERSAQADTPRHRGIPDTAAETAEYAGPNLEHDLQQAASYEEPAAGHAHGDQPADGSDQTDGTGSADHEAPAHVDAGASTDQGQGTSFAAPAAVTAGAAAAAAGAVGTHGNGTDPASTHEPEAASDVNAGQDQSAQPVDGGQESVAHGTDQTAHSAPHGTDPAASAAVPGDGSADQGYGTSHEQGAAPAGYGDDSAAQGYGTAHGQASPAAGYGDDSAAHGYGQPHGPASAGSYDGASPYNPSQASPYADDQASPSPYGQPSPGYGSANDAGQWTATTEPQQGQSKGLVARFWWVGCIVLFLIAALIAGVIGAVVLLGRGGGEDPAPDPTTTEQPTSADPTDDPTASDDPTEDPTASEDPTPVSTPTNLPTVDPSAQAVAVASSSGKGSIKVDMKFMKPADLPSEYGGTVDPSPLAGGDYLAMTAEITVEEGEMDFGAYNFEITTPYGGKISPASASYGLKDAGVGLDAPESFKAGDTYSVRVLFEVEKAGGMQLVYNTFANEYTWPVPEK